MQWEMMLLLVLAGPFVIYGLLRTGIASVRKRAEAHRKQ